MIDDRPQASGLYTRLSPEERAKRRADMKGMPWTDSRDFGMSVEQFDSTHVECPVLGGVARKEYCWERCPEDEPTGACPRRAEDPGWWHGDVESVKVETSHEGASTGAEAPVAPADEPACSPSPSRRGRRRDDRGDGLGGDRGVDAGVVDVFDLFGSG